MNRLFPSGPLLAAALLLNACETRRPPVQTAEQARPAVAAGSLARPAPAAPDTADLMRHARLRGGPRDTLVQVGAAHFRLSVQVETDSTKPIIYGPKGNVGGAYATDSAGRAGQVRGYAETYTFSLRDSLGQQVLFRRQLHKPDFYAVAPRAIVTVMNMEAPSYLGYSPGLDALVFGCYLGIPFSDVGNQATILLSRQGRVLRIAPGGPAFSDASDCDPRISPSGRAVLTCTEVLRAGKPPLSLVKPHALLRVARFLNDTTLLVMYEYGDYVERPLSAANAQLNAGEDGPDVTAPFIPMSFVTTPAQRRLPTAFILSIGGRVLRKFRFVPDYELGSDLARTWAPAAGAYLLVEAATKLVVIPKAHPENLFELPLKKLPRFRPPLRPHEKAYALINGFTRLRFYVDTLNPRAVRVAALPPAKD